MSTIVATTRAERLAGGRVAAIVLGESRWKCPVWPALPCARRRLQSEHRQGRGVSSPLAIPPPHPILSPGAALSNCEIDCGGEATKPKSFSSRGDSISNSLRSSLGCDGSQVTRRRPVHARRDKKTQRPAIDSAPRPGANAQNFSKGLMSRASSAAGGSLGPGVFRTVCRRAISRGAAVAWPRGPSPLSATHRAWLRA